MNSADRGGRSETFQRGELACEIARDDVDTLGFWALSDRDTYHQWPLLQEGRRVRENLASFADAPRECLGVGKSGYHFGLCPAPSIGILFLTETEAGLGRSTADASSLKIRTVFCRISVVDASPDGSRSARTPVT